MLAPTASRHLAMLVDAGLLVVERHGRHRYHRLASAEVARVIESIMSLAVRGRPEPRTAIVTGPRDAAMRRVRLCYDHLAGRLGVAIAERMQADGSVVIEGEHARVEAPAAASLKALGIDVSGGFASIAASKRPACRPCLDWSERSCHLAGSLGALICAHCIERRWLLHRTGARALDITAPGQLALRRWLGSEAWAKVA